MVHCQVSKPREHCKLSPPAARRPRVLLLVVLLVLLVLVVVLTCQCHSVKLCHWQFNKPQAAVNFGTGRSRTTPHRRRSIGTGRCEVGVTTYFPPPMDFAHFCYQYAL